MSSFLDRIKSGLPALPTTGRDPAPTGTPIPSSTPGIEVRLREAEGAIAPLENAHADAAYRATVGDGSDQNAAVALGALRVARDLVASLQGALKRSRQLDAERTASLKSEVERAQIASVRQHLSRRDVALARMSGHLAAAITEYAAALKAIKKAVNASPKLPPPGSTFLLGKIEIDRRIGAELYRLSAPLAERDPLHAEYGVFPGAKPDDLRNANQPSAIIPLADAARAATAGFASFLGAGPAAADDTQVAQDFETEEGVVRTEPLGIVSMVPVEPKPEPSPVRGPLKEVHPAGEGRVESDGKMTVTVKPFSPDSPGAVS